MSFNTPKVAVIPAAGKGTRFLPSTKVTPKEMHPLLNLPLIHHCLIELKNAGVEEAIIVSHKDKVALENYFKDHSELKTLLENDGKTNLVQELTNIENLPKVTFAYQEEQLGLAHAIYSAKEQINGRDFYVLLPDEIFIPSNLSQNPCVELKKEFEKTGANTISLLKVDPSLVYQYGVARTEETNGSLKISEIVEKPKVEEAPSNLILPGRYAFKNEILSYIEKTPKKNGEIQLTDSMILMGKDHGLTGVATKCPRFDGGSILGFLKANIYAAMQDEKLKTELDSFLSSF
ncbi:MAG: UTP--glucose-1-phosphate uridylyltransferase [Bdellovibrionales bacterium]